MIAAFAVLVAAALFGTTGTAQALGPDQATPVTVGAARLVVGGLALGAMGLLADAAGIRSLVARRPVWLAVAGVVAYQVCFFTGTARLGVAAGTLIALGSAPLLAGLFAAVAGQGRPDRQWAALTGVAVIGLTLLIGASPNPDLAGVVAALGAGAGYATYTVAAKSLLSDATAGVAAPAPITVMAAVFGLSVVPAAIILLIAQPAWLSTPSGVALALYLGLVPTALGYLLFGRGLRSLPAGTVATLTLAEPVVAMILAVGLLGETLVITDVLGAGLVALSLLLLGWRTTRTAPAGVQ